MKPSKRSRSSRSGSAPRERPRKSGRTRLGRYWPCLAVAGAALATYLTALPNDFVSDATGLIPENPSLVNSHEWLAWFSRPYFWGSYITGAFLYRPLTILSYLVTIRLAGVDPFPFIFGNVLLHAAVSALVLVLGRRLLDAPTALLGALLFAVHPLHTEAVAWVGGRTDLLAALFTLASMLCFLQASALDASRPLFYAVSAAIYYFAALLSKEHAITLPAWFALVWVLERRRRSARWTAVVLLGSFAALLALVALKVWVIESLPGPSFGNRIRASLWVPWRWLAGFAIVGKYTALFFWPGPLTFDYTTYLAAWARSGRVDLVMVLWGVVVVVGLLVAFGSAARAHPRLASVLAFIPISYAVVSAFPFTPQLYIAERFTYLPSVGACLAAGALLVRLGEAWANAGRTFAERLGGGDHAWAGWRRRVTVGLLVSVLAALLLRSAIRNADWRTDESLARAAVAVSPDSPLALRGLGQKELRRGNPATARALLERSHELDPRRSEPYGLLAQIYLGKGEIEKLVALSREAVQHLTQRPEMVHYLAGLLWRAGRPEEAESLLRQVVKNRPTFLQGHLALGGILLDRGQASEALDHFRVASTLKPEDPLGWFGMARASWALGQLPEARAYAARARGAGLRLPDQFLRELDRDHFR